MTSKATQPFYALESVRTRLSVVLALAMLPVLVFGVTSAISDFYARSASVERALLDKAKIVSNELKSTFVSSQQVLSFVGEQSAVRNTSQPACTNFLQSALAGLPQFANIATVSVDGAILCSAFPTDSSVSVADDKWFQTVKARHDYVLGGPLESAPGGEYVLVAAEPLARENAGNNGYIALSIRTEYVGSSLAIDAVADDTDLYLIDGRGRSLLPAQDISHLPTNEALLAFLSDDPSVVEGADKDGSARLYASVRLDDSDVYVILSRPSLSANMPVITELVGDVAALVVLFAITLLIVWLATERMSIKWVRHLQAVAQANRRGTSDARVRGFETAPIEYRELGETFNSMADAMERRQATLIQSVAERELLLKEIHHRVKNNLQIIISLFNLNARNTDDDVEKAYLRDMQMRVESLALVHHAAYQSEDMQLISTANFLPTLLEHTKRVFEEDAELTIASVETDDIDLSMDQVVPLAQLVLETLAAVRQAAGRHAPITVRLAFRHSAEGTASFTLATSVGATASETPNTKRLTLSRSLISAFARQLGATATVADDFTSVVMDVPYTRDAAA